MLRFAGFELDPQRAELRGPDRKTIKLRPKSFDMLQLFAANPGRVLSKQDLIAAIWPNVHVSDDSLFQCIREIRTALGDDRRQLIKLVSGRGYLFEAEVPGEPAGFAAEPEAALAADKTSELVAAAASGTKAGPAGKWLRFGLRGPGALATVAGLGAVVGLSAATPIFAPDFIFARPPPTIAVMPMVGAGNDREIAETAASVTGRLSDGLARIGKIRVVAVLGGTRQAALPDVPTFAELGLAGFEDVPYYGIFAPAGTPQATIDRFSAALAKVIALPEVHDRLTAMGLTVGYMTQQQLTSREHAYAQTWARIIKASGFKAQ